jgi:aminoglycoside phosphotransferase (APT) family kinase protein
MNAVAMRSALQALNGVIEPALAGEGARAALRSIRNILAYLIVEEEGPERSASLEGPVPLAMPLRWFGEGSRYLELDRQFKQELGDGSLSIRDLQDNLSWEARCNERIVTSLNVELSSLKGQAAATIDAIAVENYLKRRIPNARVLSAVPFADGRSKLTGLIRIAGGGELPEQIVLRVDRAVSATQAPSVIQEFEILRRLHAKGMRVPEPLLKEIDPGPLGAPFILMSRVAGAPASGLLGPPRSKNVARELARELAILHSIPLAQFDGALPSCVIPAEVDALAELDTFERTWRDHEPEPSMAMNFGLKWLREHIALATQGAPALTHRDPLFHNVLAEDEHLSALLDWEFVRVGFPAEDLGWIRASVSRAMPWPEFMKAYTDAGGSNVSAEEVDFYSVWASVRLGSMLTYSNWLLSRGMAGGLDFLSTSMREMHVARTWLSENVLRVARAG